MRNLVKIDGQQNMYRDVNSKAIIVCDEKDKSSYSNQKRLFEEHINMKSDIKKINNDIEEIKSMLSSILKGN